MTETLTIINTITLLATLIIYLLARKRYGANAFVHPLAGDKLSMLNRRRKALRLATKDWHKTVESGYTSLAGEQKHLVDQLEREVAELENERFGTTEEEHFAPKLEAPKRKSVTTVKYRSDDNSKAYYQSFCHSCGWSWLGRSKWIAEENSAEHEMSHV